jgi:ATP-binding cassette subfamily F protein 3
MAPIIINADDLGVALSGRTLFSGLALELQAGQRVGLVGPNGSGKSTLLKLIAREIEPDSGNIYRKPGLTWGRLEQEPRLPSGTTVFDEAMKAVARVARLEREMARLEADMGDELVYGNEEALAKVMAEHEALLVEYEQLEGPSYESRVRETLSWLRFDVELQSLDTANLSGGQKKLLMLAKLIVQKPALLLLDEPDNHLDLAGKQSLERIISGYKGTVVIVSHDRYLLDEVATHIAELEGGRLTLYLGNYTAFANERELRRLRQQQLHAAQQKEITRIEAAIKRFELWASLVVNERHIRQARSRQKMLEKMDKIEQVAISKRMSLDLAGWRGSNKVVELLDVVMTFEDGHTIFRGLNLTLWHGERVGLVGPNGAGKSQLFKQILLHDGFDAGEVKIGPSIQIGYYSQEQETLNQDQNLIDAIRQAAPLSRDAAVAYLNRFLFNYDQTQGSIGLLSGGERSRLQLALLVLRRPNLLLLDEPTNNLDINAIEVLEETLEEFEGTVFVISHDRYFLDKVVDKVVELQDGRFNEYMGGYTDYLENSG